MDGNLNPVVKLGIITIARRLSKSVTVSGYARRRVMLLDEPSSGQVPQYGWRAYRCRSLSCKATNEALDSPMPSYFLDTGFFFCYGSRHYDG